MTLEAQELEIKRLSKEIEELKTANTRFLEQIEEESKKKPEMLLKILEIANKNGLSKKQKEQLINDCIKMADDFRKQNKEKNKKNESKK